MLNAELKSMNSILTYESLFSRWVRARWRVEEIASSTRKAIVIPNQYKQARRILHATDTKRSKSDLATLRSLSALNPFQRDEDKLTTLKCSNLQL